MLRSRAPYLSALACVMVLGSSCVPSLSQNKPREPNKTVPGSFAGSQPSAANRQRTEVVEVPTRPCYHRRTGRESKK